MTQKEKVSKLIDIIALITKRCKKIELDNIQQMISLEKRIADLEFVIQTK